MCRQQQRGKKEEQEEDNSDVVPPNFDNELIFLEEWLASAKFDEECI